jgi:hypothetical protein
MWVATSAVIAACSSRDLLEPASRSDQASRPLQTVVPVTGQQIAVPAYFGPSSPDWNKLLSNVPPANLIVINPNNGPGASLDTGYVSKITAAHARHGRVLGYVYTKYANTQPDSLHGGALDRTISAVEADIDRYYSFYSNLDGIFLDEVTGGSDCTHAQSYYQPIHDHIVSAHPDATVVVNPGTAVDSCYLSVADIVVTFESSFADYQNAWNPSGRDWETAANASRIWHIVHSASSSQWSTALDLSRTRNAGYVYVTSLTADPNVNTFGSLPSYFDTEAANVKAYSGSFGGGNAIALSRWRGSNDGVNEHYSLHFSQPFTFYRVYIDSDHSAATGFPVSGIGADYLIENSTLYVHGAAGWNWTPIGSSGQVTSGSYTQWTVPRATIGETSGSPIQNAGSYEHVYSASSGPITGYFAENNSTNAYYQANFAQAFTLKHVLIDTDMNPATGYAFGGIGADYLIENDHLYRHAGGGWRWTLISSIAMAGGTTGQVSWTVPRASIGETAASGELSNVIFEGRGGFTAYAAPVYRHVYTR